MLTAMKYISISISLLLSLKLSACVFDCLPGTASATLDVNGYPVTIYNDGTFLKNLFEENGKSMISASALWVGGLDLNGNLKFAASTYPSTQGTDYYPGPLDLTTASTNSAMCQLWDRISTVRRSDIIAHQEDYLDGSIDVRVDEIFAWPAAGNRFSPEYNDGLDVVSNMDLAPFVDFNGNGIYEPDLGEYPDIKGDQAAWYIINDNGGPHNYSLATPAQIEIHTMVYGLESDDPLLARTLYYDFRVINRAPTTLFEMYLANWSDMTPPCFGAGTEKIGVDTMTRTAFAYPDTTAAISLDNCDTSVLSSTVMPLSTISLLSNRDQPSQLHSFIYFNRINQLTGDPRVSPEMYNYLRGLWRDGTPLTYGGSGYNPGSTDTIRFAFPSDPSDTDGWSMCTVQGENVPFDDRRTVMSSGPYDLLPGEGVHVTFAITDATVPMDTCPGLTEILDDLEVVRSVDVISSTEIPRAATTVDLAPNPATSTVRIGNSKTWVSLDIFSTDGRLIQSEKVSDEGVIDVSLLLAGLYIVHLIDQDGQSASIKLIKL